MDMQKIKKALDTEFGFYGLYFGCWIVVFIVCSIHAGVYNKVWALIAGLIALFIAYLNLKRATYLRLLKDSIK